MTATQTNNGTAVEWFNRFLRGELSAVETYKQALEKFGKDGGTGTNELRRLHDDHVAAVHTIREHVRTLGGTPDDSSGAWGSFATAVQGVAQLFGNASALKALKEGEEHGLKDYERGLEDKDLPTECKSLIQSSLLPPCRDHVRVIDGLMAAQ